MTRKVPCVVLLLGVFLVGCGSPPPPTPTVFIPLTPTPLPPLAPQSGSQGVGPDEMPDEAHCGDQVAGNRHAEGEALSQEFAVSYEEVMGLFCQGMGFGEIRHTYRIHQQTGTPVSEIVELFQAGVGWGDIRKQLGAGPAPEEDGD